MVLPAIPIQMVFAQQTARALASENPGRVSTLVRMSIYWTAAIWAVFAVVALVFQDTILAQWKVSNPAGLWFTLPVMLSSLVLPMFWGVLQGAQNFLWLGWSLMLNSLGRVVGATFAVLVLGSYAAGMLSGVLFGLLCGLAVGLFQTRQYWTQKPAAYDWHALGRQVVPLLLGFVGFQVLFTVDTMFVKAYFPQDEAGFYVSAGTLARALLWLVLPLAAVMFPKLVHSAVKDQKTNLSGMVLLGTFVLATGGAVGLTVMGPLVIRLVYKASYLETATALLPWYGSVMIPLAIGNVLLNDLLARPQPRLALGLSILALALAYMWGLTQFHSTLLTVLKTMGTFNLLFLGVCGWFTWREKRAS